MWPVVGKSLLIEMKEDGSLRLTDIRHEPVLPGGTEIAGAPRAMNARHAAFVAGAAVAVNAWLQ